MVQSQMHQYFMADFNISHPFLSERVLPIETKYAEKKLVGGVQQLQWLHPVTCLVRPEQVKTNPNRSQIRQENAIKNIRIHSH